MPQSVRLGLAGLGLLAVSAAAPLPGGAEHVDAGSLAAAVAKPVDGLANHFVFGNRAARAQFIRRDAAGQVERHALMNDVMIARAGNATVTLGGRIEGGAETTPGELRGGRIIGGRTQAFRPGDMLWIPAGLPHQVVPDPGTSFTYVVIKSGA